MKKRTNILSEGTYLTMCDNIQYCGNILSENTLYTYFILVLIY